MTQGMSACTMARRPQAVHQPRSSRRPGIPHRPQTAHGPRTVRGVLAASLAVGSAAGAHTVGGHHAPHAVILILALAVSIPLCTALSTRRLSRGRLAVAVLLSQGALHGLFELFPAGSAAAVHDGSGSAGGHAAGHHDAVPAPLPASAPDASSLPADSASGVEWAMVAMHALAAVVSYLLLRRGEVILAALMELLDLRPAVLRGFDSRAPLPPRPRVALRDSRETLPGPWAIWPGEGPRTLRGPPLHTF